MMFQAVIEPVIIGFEADQDTGWPAMSRDDDLLRLGETQEARKVILHLSQGHAAESGCRARRATPRLRLS